MSAVTHADRRCTQACAAYCDLVAHLLDGASPTEAVARVLAHAPMGDDVASAVAAAGGLTAGDLDPGGYVISTLQVGVWALLQPRPLEDVLVDVVNLGGDADTTGAVAGELLGVRDGVDAIPRRWVDAWSTAAGSWPSSPGCSPFATDDNPTHLPKAIAASATGEHWTPSCASSPGPIPSSTTWASPPPPRTSRPVERRDSFRFYSARDCDMRLVLGVAAGESAMATSAWLSCAPESRAPAGERLGQHVGARVPCPLMGVRSLGGNDRVHTLASSPSSGWSHF